MKSSTFIRYLLSVFFISSIGCGGGSTGTDGGGITVGVNGIVKDSSGLPLQNVHITVTESGEEAFTDKKGAFEVQSQQSSSQVTLLVSKGDEESSPLEIAQKVEDGDSISVTLLLDEGTFNVEVDTLTITEKGTTGTPTPVATPSGSFSTPTPTLVPKEEVDSVSGTILTSTGVPVSGVRVSFQNRSVNATSNSKGKFSLEGKISRAQSYMILSAGGKVKKISLGILPERPVSISIKLVLIQVSGQGGVNATDVFQGAEVVVDSLEVL